MKTLWWKILTVVIMLYVIIAGFLVPLRPGIQSSQPTSAACGDQVTLQVTGYNTQWSEEASQVKAWLRSEGEQVIPARQVHVTSDERSEVTFAIPGHWPFDDDIAAFSLIIDAEKSGPAILPNALVVTCESKGESGSALWSDQIDSLHFTKTFAFPYRNVLLETIRNTYFHVPLWMAMFALLLIAVIYNGQYLRSGKTVFEEKAYHLTLIALIFGVLGIGTGMVWAEYTWGRFWSWDIKQTMSLLTMLMYIAYVFIRFSIFDETMKRRMSAVYGLFAFAMLIPLLYIIPRMAASLHPGSGGNPAMGGEDMDNTMRMVFYPAIIGYTLMGLWLAQLSYRIRQVREKVKEATDS